MKLKFFTAFLFAAVCFVLTGCTSVQNYSLRSYQGPLPMEDYRFINAETYGVPLTPQ